MILRELKEGLWIKRGTRYISLDFQIYNANVNLFCVIKYVIHRNVQFFEFGFLFQILTFFRLNFEFPPTGGIISHGEFVTVKLLRYITKSDYALMGAEFILAAMLLYYLVEEGMEIKANKLEYFVSFWNCLDICVILVK